MSDQDVYRTELRPLVKAGAQLLDEREPGWAQRIDVQGLEMSACKACVLGQLYGDFGAGMDRLWGSKLSALGEASASKMHGFGVADLTEPEEFYLEVGLRYDTLRVLWLEQIRERTGGEL